MRVFRWSVVRVCELARELSFQDPAYKRISRSLTQLGDFWSKFSMLDGSWRVQQTHSLLQTDWGSLHRSPEIRELYDHQRTLRWDHGLLWLGNNFLPGLPVQQAGRFFVQARPFPRTPREVNFWGNSSIQAISQGHLQSLRAGSKMRPSNWKTRNTCLRFLCLVVTRTTYRSPT